MRNAIAACAALLLGASAAAAETYPSRRITAIVPFAAGSGTDSVARIVSQKLSEVLKTTIVIDNRGGANGTIGATAGARADADGYNLVFGGSSTHAAAPSMVKSIQYDPKTDFAPIAQLGLFPYFLFVNPEVPAKSVRELVAYGKSKPEALSFAYGNAIGQLSGELLKRQAGVPLLAVPYKSSPPALTDVVAGRVSMIFVDMTAAQSLAQAGQLRTLATTTQTRSELYGDLPSMKEEGVDFRNLSAWTGLFAPKNTPPDIVAKLSESLKVVLEDPAVRKRLGEIGFEAKWIGPKDFAQHVASDVDLWAQLTKDAGIEPQ